MPVNIDISFLWKRVVVKRNVIGKIDYGFVYSDRRRAGETRLLVIEARRRGWAVSAEAQLLGYMGKWTCHQER